MLDAIAKFFGGPFHEMVEQATSELLLSPDMDRNLTLCDQANLKVDNAKEILKALRRRTAHINPKVNYLSIVLLGMLVKNGAHHVHREVASNKDLLQDLLKLASRPALRDGAQEVKTEAIRLLLSFEVWFRGSPDLGSLARLADQVREAGEITDSMNFDILPLQGPQQPLQRLVTHQQSNQRRRPQQPHPEAVHQIRAITQGEIDQMFETLEVMAEMLNVAADPSQGVGNIQSNELLMDIAHQVKQHYTTVALYISSGAIQPDQLEVLLLLNESQTQTMERLARLAGALPAADTMPTVAPRPQPTLPHQPTVAQPHPQNSNVTVNNNALDDLFASPVGPAPVVMTQPLPPMVPPQRQAFPGIPMQPVVQQQYPTVPVQQPQPVMTSPPAARPPKTDEDDVFNQFAASRDPEPKPPVAPAPVQAPAAVVPAAVVPAAMKKTSSDEDFSQFATSRDQPRRQSITVPNVVEPTPAVKSAAPTLVAAPMAAKQTSDDFEAFAATRDVPAVQAAPTPAAPAPRAETDDFDNFLDARLGLK
jgi:hypothetical protein